MADEITKDDRIAILVYKEDHPEAHLPEICDATGFRWEDVDYVIRKHESETTRYTVVVENEFFDKKEAEAVASKVFIAGAITEVVDVTPCAYFVSGRNGHRWYCEAKGPHSTHRVEYMGEIHEFDKDGEET